MKYNIELEVITPLSIGSGNDNEWVPGVDFVTKEGNVYVLDISKAVANGVIDTKGIEQLTNLFVKYDEKGIINLFGRNLENATKYIFSLPASTSNPIKAFLRTQLYDKPVVAGSSLKGAIRSALFKYLRENEKDNVSVFGTMNDGTDFMRFIQISDIEMPSSILVNSKLFNLRKENGVWRGGWKHRNNETSDRYQPTGFNTIYECIEPRKKGQGTIKISTEAFDLLFQRGNNITISHPNEKVSLIHDGISVLFSAINHATREYLNKEMNYFQNYPADRTEELIDNINNLLDMIPLDNSYCLMKMSAGVGFHSITGDWQYDDYSNTGTWDSGKNAGKQRYKSRKTAEYRNHLQLMGFVKIRELSNEESNRLSMTMKEEHDAIINSRIIPIREREAALLASVQEAERRKMESEELSRKEKEYQRIILEAKKLYSDKQWDQAILKAQEASTLFPDRQEPFGIIDNCNTNKASEAFKEKQQQDQNERFSKPLQEVIQNVASIGNLTGTVSKWLKSDNHSLGNAEFSAILDRVKSFKDIAPKEWKALPKKRKDFVKSIGEDWTTRLFAEINI